MAKMSSELDSQSGRRADGQNGSGLGGQSGLGLHWAGAIGCLLVAKMRGLLFWVAAFALASTAPPCRAVSIFPISRFSRFSRFIIILF